MAVIYMVTVESEGLSADWDDDVIVVAADPQEAIRMAERDVIGNHPLRQLKDEPGTSMVFELDSTNVRVVGALVPQDER